MRAFLNFVCNVAAPLNGPPSRESRTVWWQSTRLGDERTSEQGLRYFGGQWLTPEEAAVMTKHMRDKRASRFLGDTTLFFEHGVTVCIPHTRLPVKAGWGAFELEIAGDMSNDLVAWLWDASLDCSMAFRNYKRPTAIIGPPSGKMKERWPDIVSLKKHCDLKRWLTESKSVLIY